MNILHKTSRAAIFKGVHMSVTASDNSVINLITRLIVLNTAPSTELFCNCPLLKDISFNIKFLLVWYD